MIRAINRTVLGSQRKATHAATLNQDQEQLDHAYRQNPATQKALRIQPWLEKETARRRETERGRHRLLQLRQRPCCAAVRERQHPALKQARAIADTAGSLSNDNKSAEYGPGAMIPPKGQTAAPADPSVAASTLSEENESEKTGPRAPDGVNAADGRLPRVRADSSGQVLTTNQGIWDLVGNNMPVFFIQDAIKFPDLVHAVKPEPHNAMPQAASAHDTFWDFISLMPESIHVVNWLMSDRAIPRSFRTMQGFGVHTFRFVTAEGDSKFVKFHWNPKLGTHSLVWDEAVKVAGADPDFNRRDLWEAIEAGEYPEWELAVQIFDEEQAEQFSFDILDSTKIVPEELVPLTPIGRMVLDCNPDNFFAETEQVAFCAAHVVPGIDFTNDPLLAGRIHSYVDTQLLRLGGPNFHEIPINAPLAPVHNYQRDGFHRQTIHRGRVSYEPNSLAGGCPFQAGSDGYMHFPEPVSGEELKGQGREVRRALPSGDPVQREPDRLRETPHHRRLLLRAEQADRVRHPGAHGGDAAQRLRVTRRGGGCQSRHGRAARAIAPCERYRDQTGNHLLPVSVADGPAR